MRRRIDRSHLRRVALLVAACTLVLTASFVGVLALTTGATAGVAVRLPWYVLAAAATFVGALLLAEQRTDDGQAVLVAAGVTGGVAFLVVALAAEGIVYAATNPGRALNLSVLLYVVAAALVGTGIGYWGINHWREVTGGSVGVRSPPGL